MEILPDWVLMVLFLLLRITRTAITAINTESIISAPPPMVGMPLAPGTVVPEHSHSLDEERMVLEGKLRVGPEELGPGDYLLGKKGIDHPEITTAEGALLLIRSESQTSEL